MHLLITIEGMAAEEEGDTAKALKAYREVLNVDPGEADLACRGRFVAYTSGRFFPQRSMCLKDAVKATPRASEPYLQLAFIYAKYLKKIDQAVDYGKKAIRIGSAEH